MPCCEPSTSSPHKGGSTPASSAAAHLSLPTPRSASRSAASGQPYASHAASQTHATHTPEGKACHPALKALLRTEPAFSRSSNSAPPAESPSAARAVRHSSCQRSTSPPKILSTRPVACSASLLPLKHYPAAIKSSRFDCVKERGISIEGQSLSRQCGNLSFGLLRLFFRGLRLFSRPTSSTSVCLLSGLPICIAAPFPRRSSKAAFPQGSSLVFLDKGWKDQLWVDFAGFIHCVSSLSRRCSLFQGCVLWARNG